MITINKILTPTMIGTSAMTLFSYLVSEWKNKNFREPEVLAQLAKRLPTDVSKETAHTTGWSMHYGIGLAFVLLYIIYMQQTKTKSSLTSGTLFGLISGVIGIGGWKFMFERHPNPPAKNLKSYFGHLLLAHIVFGVFSALTHRITQDRKIVAS